jgi:hypothetical protein
MCWIVLLSLYYLPGNWRPDFDHFHIVLGIRNEGGEMRQANPRVGALRRYLVFTAWLVVAALRPATAAEPIPNVGPAREVVKVATGFGFTEGPAWDGKAVLYFTDIPNARIHTVDAAGKTPYSLKKVVLAMD